MARKSDEGVPALQNDEVTGMTEEKQEEIVRRRGRKDAAKEFYAERANRPARHPHRGGIRNSSTRPAGLEPATHSLEGCCSIQLSYGRRRLPGGT